MRPSLSRRGLLLASSATLAAALAGCVVVPAGRHGGYAGGGYGAPGGGYPYASEPGPVVDVAPPPPQYEVQPAMPGPGYVWIGGYWGWNLGRHVWIGGRWSLPPAGHAWVPGYWGRHGHGWRWHGGHWGRR